MYLLSQKQITGKLRNRIFGALVLSALLYSPFAAAGEVPAIATDNPVTTPRGVVKQSIKDLYIGLRRTERDLQDSLNLLRILEKKIDKNTATVSWPKAVKAYTKILDKNYGFLQESLIAVQKSKAAMDWSGQMDPAPTCQHIEKWNSDLENAQQRKRFSISNEYLSMVQEFNTKFKGENLDITAAEKITSETESLLTQGQDLLSQLEDKLTTYMKDLTEKSGCGP